MSCDNKPPMTVWLAFDAVDCFERDEDCGASDFKNHHHHIGPYVHLKQFMEEVERRAGSNAKTRSWDMSLGEAKADAMQELAKEIQEGKE